MWMRQTWLLGTAVLAAACAYGAGQAASDDDAGAGGSTSGANNPASSSSGGQASTGSNTSTAVGGSTAGVGGNAAVGAGGQPSSTGSSGGMSASSGSGGMSASSGSTSSGSGGMGAGQTVEVGPMLNLSIPNNSYDGTKSTMVCADLVAPSEAVNVVAEVTLEIGIDHDWVGDLTIKLDSPSGTTVTLMSMPGEIRSADDGSGFSFESSDLVASAPILFLAGAAVSAEDMGLSLANSEVICQDDAICEYAPDHGAATASALSDFIGEASNGTWEICVADSVGGNSGTLDAAKLTIVK